MSLIVDKFIKTSQSEQRIQKIIDGIQSGIPVLLEGPTGTSKTRSAKMACEMINQKCITLNFSSQTKIEDLLGQMARNSDQFGGFSFKKGPYSEAYEKGYCLILDEINLAHETVLQSIEASLDLGFLSFDAPGVGTEVIPMHPQFHIIATQNPLTGRFSQKRQFLSEKFLSRFLVINFNDISKEELLEIAYGLAAERISNKIIQKIVNFHFLFQKREMNEIHVFTIREIASTIQSILNGYTPYESLLYHYGSRYEKKKLTEIKKLIEQCKIKESYSENGLNLQKYDKQLFCLNTELTNVFNCAWSILRDFHPILLIGPDGCGKTSIARWIGSLIPIGRNQSNPTKLFVCNQEMTISDIIGRYMPIKNTKMDDEDAPIRWINGPIIEAIKNGEILILDQIDTAPSTILERLNSLYDGLGSSDFIFTVQENPEESEVHVNPYFRIIATASEKGLNELSPAFLNRFTIIYINDQIPEIFRNKQVIQYSTFLSNNLFLPQCLTKRLTDESNKMTISRFAKIVRGFSTIKKKFKTANDNDITNFLFSVTDQNIKTEESTSMSKTKYNEPVVSEAFASILLDSLDDKVVDEKNDAFYFKEASSTRKVMATLVACSLIGQHVIMIGKTGLGKTAAAMAFARMSTFSKGQQMISFNGETQLEELFGFFTIEKGNFTLHNGPLSNAMINGQVFIADELNLAEQQIIQSLNVAVEPMKNETITVPVVGSNVKVDPGFFFIGCQNDITMFGRRPLPESFKKKVLCLEYPEPSPNDLLNLTIEISKQFDISRFDSQCTVNLIEKLKEHPLFKTKPWSLREVRKLFRRTYYSNRHQDSITGIKIHHHAAFMLRSSFRSESEISKDAVNIISMSFKLKEQEKIMLLNDMDANVNVRFTDGNNKVTINKGTLTLNVIQNTLNSVPEELQSFWQLFFEANIAHFAEPLLLVGPSGFKTFLAKMLLPLSPPVYLHNDSTTSSLIGQIALLDKYQAKLFLLDSLRMFVGINPIGNLFNEIRSSIESDDLKKADLDNLIQAIKEKAPESFDLIIDTIGANIIALDKNEQTNSLFSNYASIFKPGLITRAIFEQNSLILKNIAQPSPTVLERFNELLSVTPTLTLFEDTSNTFTPENSKVLFNFSQRFRIIGICLPHEKHGLSDAMLSRLTEINVPSYTESEKSLVYSILMKNDPKSFSQYFDSLMKVASEIFKDTFDIDLSFALSTQIAKITKKWSIYYQSKDMTKDINTLFAFALFRCAGGFLLTDTEDKAVLIQSMNETELRLPNEFSKLFEEADSSRISYEPHLQIINNQATEILESTLTGFSADTILGKLPKENNLLFTNSFSDLVDLVVSMADILQPLLIEGESGCGKSSAVSYVANCVGAKVIRISISQSTTIEDLFGKVEPSSNSDSLKFDFIETDLLHALRADREDAYITNWIVIEELHLASAAVLDALGAVFNPDSEQIWLPNGDYVNKGRYFIIGLLSKPISHQAIVNTAVYYKVSNYSQDEFCAICTNILKNEDYGFVSSEFCDKIVKLAELTSNSHLKVPITAREAYKFIKMMKISNNLLMPDLVMEMLFLGRFLDEESQVNAKKEFYRTDDKSKAANLTSVVPYITVQNNATVLNSGDAKIAIQKNYSCHRHIKSLTVSQRQLFQFMTLAINSSIPLVVQGPTSSGKTYIINLFAKIVGQKLRVIQLNSETTSASIAGNYQPSSTLNEGEYMELSNYLKQLSKLNILPNNFLTKINRKQVKDWNPNEFKEIRNFLNQNLNKYDKNVRPICEQYIKKVDSALQFFNHLIRKDSTIVECLVEGDWLLLDGIESAPADLFDRLFTLLDDEPTLNLYERGKGFIYSKKATNKKYQISDNFRLFMTYNPTNTKSSSISPAFLSRCALFTLNPIDSNIKDSALAISGLLHSMRFELDDNLLAIAVRLAKVHKEAKDYVKDDPSVFFTGRTFVHLCRSLKFEHSEKGIISNDCLYNMVKKHYCQFSQSLWNSPEFYRKLTNPLSKPVKQKTLKDINEIRLVSSKHCIALTKIIDNFKQSLNHSSDEIPLFQFQNFIYHLPKLQLKDVQEIIEKFEDMGQAIHQKINQFSPKELMHFAAINTLYLLLLDAKNAFNEVLFNPKFQDLAIDSEQLNVQPQFHQIINKINCLFYLVQNKLFIPFIPSVLTSRSIGEDASRLIQRIQENSPFNNIVVEYMKSLRIDLDIFDYNSPSAKLLKILGNFKKKEFRIVYIHGKSSQKNVIYFVFDQSGQNCIYLSIKVDNNVVFRQKSQFGGFPIMFLIYILETVYNHFYVDESIQIPTELNEQAFPISDTRVLLNLDNLWCFENDDTEYSNINKICGCLYGNGNYPQFFFTGVMKLFFNLSFDSLTSDNYESFVKWIVWLNKFFMLFSNSNSFSSEKDQFISEVTQILYDTKSDEMIDNVENTILSFPYNEIKSPEVDYIFDKLNESIGMLSHDLEDLHLNELKDQKKREIERNFILIKRDIATKISTNRDKVLPLQSLLNAIKDIEHTEQSFNIVNNIVNSITQDEEETNKKFGFRWPNQNEAPSKNQPDEYFILKTLLDYSDEINRINDIQAKPTWMKLCQIQAPNSVLIDFLKTEKISKTAISLLQKRERVKYIKKLMDEEVKSYLEPRSIRIFLNEFYNRFKEISNGWVQKVQEFADKYPPNYLIHLPKFEPTDLLALLVDPFTSIPGPLLSNEIEYNNILNDFFNLYNGTFKNFSHMLVSIQNNFQQLCIKYIHIEKGKMSISQFQKMRFNEFYSHISKLPEIPGVINEIGSCISKITNIEEYINRQSDVGLIYDDIYNLNGNDYIDNNPVAYFYLSLFPLVKEYLKPIENFKDSSRFPLALLGFRVMSRSNCIQMQLPMTFQTETISSIVSKIVCDYLSKFDNDKRNRKSSNFHNVIGFLIENPPRNIETNYTGHFRSALITVMSFVKNETLFKMVQDEICKILPEAIKLMLSNEWEKMVREKFDPNNEILMFMRNPWSLIFNKIITEYENERDQVIEHINMMISFIIKGTNDQISENTKSIYDKAKIDEENLVKENKIELLKFEKYYQENEEDEDIKEVRNYWKTYNIHLLNALGKIKNYNDNLSQIPSDEIYLNLQRHFENITVSFPTAKVIPILVIKSKDKKEKSISLTVTHKNTKSKVVIKGNLNKGITMLKLTENKDNYEFKYNDKTEYKIYEVKYDPQFQPIKTFKLSIMESSYNSFVPIFKKIEEKTSLSDLSKFKIDHDEVVLNDDQDIGMYVENLNDVKNRWTDEFKEKLELNKYPSIFERMNSDIATIRSYYPPKFKNGRFRQPVETMATMKKLMSFLTSVESQLTKAKEELSNDLLEKDLIFNDKKSEFNQIQDKIKNIQIFPQINLSKNTKYDFKSKNGEKILSEDLLAPSITSSNDKNKPFINIKEINLNIGPLMSGIHTTPLRFRMVNFVSRKFDCLPVPNDPNLPIPTIESKTGFFIISIPVEELNVSLDKEKDILFEGDLHFRFEEENKDFATIHYNINLHFTPPTIFLHLQDQKFAVKDGKAKIADFYCCEGSQIVLSTVENTANRSTKFAVQIVEQIDNTAPRPLISLLPSKATLTIPSKNEKEDLFSSCLNIVFSSKLSASLYFRTKIEDSSFCFALFSDTHKDFVTDNAVINFGILQRDVYFILSWLNPNNTAVQPKINLNIRNEQKINVSMKTFFHPFRSKKLETYIYHFTISATNMKITQMDQFNGNITCSLDKNKTKKINFSLDFKPVSVFKNFDGDKTNLKYDHNYPLSAFYGRNFVNITKQEDENMITNGQFQLIVSPFSYSYFSSKGEHCRIYYKWNGSYLYSLTNGLNLNDLFDVLCIDVEGNVYIDQYTSIRNDNSDIVKLFAILKNNRQSIFPLFGKNTYARAKPLYLDPNAHNMSNFIYFFASFLDNREKNQRDLFHCGTLKNAFQELTHQDNFGYFIDFFGHLYDEYDFVAISQKIDQLLGYNYFYPTMINAVRKIYNKDKMWEFMSFVDMIYKYICSFIETIEKQNQYSVLPIPYEQIKLQQEYQLKVAGLDLESIKNNSKLYQTLIKGTERQQENEKTAIDRMKKEGYKISEYVKWSYATGFSIATAKEVNEMKKSEANVTQNEKQLLKVDTSSAYLVNPSLIEIPTMNNNISLASAFNSFNQYLKAAYQFPFSLYSSIEKRDPKLINESSDILNKLYTIFSWSKNESTSNYSVFKQFINDFQLGMLPTAQLCMALKKSALPTWAMYFFI